MYRSVFGGVLLFTPPSFVRCNLVVEAKKPTPIYVPANGKLTFVSRQFDRVQAGEKIAQIESREIDQQLRSVENELNRSRNLVEQLGFRSNEDPLAAVQVAVIQKNIEANLAELAVLQQERSKLTVTAPADGIVLPASIRRAIFRDYDELRKWQGHLTDEINQNCFVQRGEQLMLIHAPNEKTITLFVGEREIDYLKKGQSIQMLFAQIPGTIICRDGG